MSCCAKNHVKTGMDRLLSCIQIRGCFCCKMVCSRKLCPVKWYFSAVMREFRQRQYHTISFLADALSRKQQRRIAVNRRQPL